MTWHLLLPWPVTPADVLLADMVARARQTPHQWTDFLGTEPYGAGMAPISVRSDRDGTVRLPRLLGGGRTAELLLNEEGRIAEETLTDPKHVILRRFVYPDRR